MWCYTRKQLLSGWLALGVVALLLSSCGLQFGTPQAAPTSAATAAAPSAALAATATLAPTSASATGATAVAAELSAGQRPTQSGQMAANAPGAIVPASTGQPATAGNTAAQPSGTPAVANNAGSLPLTMVKGMMRQEDGFLEIVGVVKNNTSSYIGRARVLFRFYDAQNNQVAVETFDGDEGYKYPDFPNLVFNDWALTEREVIPPGESSAFRYLRELTKIKGQIASYDTNLFGFEAMPGIDAVVEEVKIERDAELGNITITGQMRATGSVPCKNPLITAGGFNKEGVLVEVDSVRLSQPDNHYETIPELKNGATHPFKLLMVFAYGQPLPVDNIEVWPGCSEF